MRINKRVIFVVLLIATLVSSNLALAHGNRGRGHDIIKELRLRARLIGPAIDGIVPFGNAVFRDRIERGIVKFSAEIEDVNLPDGTLLKVFVDPINKCKGSMLGTIKIDSALEKGGELSLDSRDGDTIPSMKKNDIVSVCKEDGTAVLSGEVMQKSRMDSRGRR